MSITRSLWQRFATPLFWLAVAGMSILATGWLLFKFEQLLFDPNLTGSSPTGPVDLVNRQIQVKGLFAGEPLYETTTNAVYPPASYLLLWPLLGWLSEQGARWLWAATSLGSLAWLGWLTVRASGETVRVRRIFLALLPAVLFGTGATIGVGQVGLHLLPALVASLLLLGQRQRWSTDLLAAALFMLTLVKPTMSAPFFWLVLLLPSTTEGHPRLRPALLVLVLYAASTVGLSLFQPADPITLLQQWWERGVAGAWYGGYSGGVINQQTWLSVVGLGAYGTELSLLILMAWGGWLFVYRRQDAWLLIGATAIVARLWIYHRYHDDILLLLPLIAFYRLARNEGWQPSSVAAAILFGIGLFTTVTPLGSWRLPAWWVESYQLLQGTTWVVMLICLMVYAERARRRLVYDEIADVDASVDFAAQPSPPLTAR